MTFSLLIMSDETSDEDDEFNLACLFGIFSYKSSNECWKVWGCCGTLILFIESAAKQWDDVQHLHNDEVSAELNVLLLADDFAGNLIMPWFGRNRPSKDYYVYQIWICLCKL